MPNPAEQMMRAAIEAAEDSQTPFGAALAMGDEVFVTAACQIDDLNNPEKYAANAAIRKLTQILRKEDLSGFTLYMTCEPFEDEIRTAFRTDITSIFFGCYHSEISGLIPKELHRQKQHSYPVEMTGGILKMECYKVAKRFI